MMWIFPSSRQYKNRKQKKNRIDKWQKNIMECKIYACV